MSGKKIRYQLESHSKPRLFLSKEYLLSLGINSPAFRGDLELE